MKDLLKLALVLAPLLCAASLAQQSVEHPVQVSMLQLIATPEKFNGTIVAVQGFLDTTSELLYLSQADADNMLIRNSISIRPTEQMRKEELPLNAKYVTVVGVFGPNAESQRGRPPGSIVEVKVVKLWSDPVQPLNKRLKSIPGVDPGS